ncbi:MAG TPA: DUF1501 domain-containing protein [Pirellulales bacterium]|jgi:hypothetical protein
MAARFNRRRWMVEIGSLGVLGLNLPSLLERVALAAPNTSPAKARSCILFFLEGGPAHQDLWDLKPQAPAEIRGDFRPIATSVPGIQVCEHLPLLAAQMHLVAQVRSVHHTVVDHNAGAYYALTGREPLRGGRLIVHDEPDNFPPYGAVLARLRPTGRALPAAVQLPDIMSNNGYDLPGQNGGFLGAACDPFVTGDPSAPGFHAPGLALPVDVPHDRLAGRRALRDLLDKHTASWEEGADFATHYRQAFELLSTGETQQAFDLDDEPARIRERYGLPDRRDRSVEARKFGGLPHLGQSMLLARRLIESGVRLVTVCTGRRFDQSWDTHRQHFPLLKKSLLPYVDRAFAALLADLAERGLLDSTLVVAMGEFGRTPRLGQITSGAGADAAGRDHWPHCYTVLLAGGGVRGGALFGASDQHAAYPKSDAVTPEDIAATIYHALGIAPETQLVDPLGRPHAVALGTPIQALFG